MISYCRKIRSLWLAGLAFTLSINCCLPKKEKSDIENLQIVRNTASDNLSGKELSKMYCSACHLFPEPALLNKKMWRDKVLPHMGSRMGIRDALKDPYEGMSMMDRMIVRKAGIFPDLPYITDLQWDKIKIYYMSHAPEKLDPIRYEVSPTMDNKFFNLELSTLNLPTGGLTTMVRQNPYNHNIYVGDGRNTLAILDNDLVVMKLIDMPSPPLDIEFISENEIMITCVGILHPNEQHQGSLLRMDTLGYVQTILPNLRRPVSTLAADFNGDQNIDYLISEYGNNVGELVLYENLGEDKFREHVLKNSPGAIQSFIYDFNGDDLPDILTLFAQGDEGFYKFINHGDNRFTSEPIIRFPPVYGSSYFNIADFNGDGYKDILYINGDNADYTFILKPYHGVRIFLNDGNDNFEESYFYPMYGASYGEVHDFDEDGDEDIVVLSFFPDFGSNGKDNLIFLENTTQAQLSFKPYYYPGSEDGRWLIVSKMDYDLDSDMDLMLGSFTYSPAPTPMEMKRKWQYADKHIGVMENRMKKER
jgi:hypothetical protein